MPVYQYFDSVAYLKEKLDAICEDMGIEEYEVSSERKINAMNARVAVISAMAGPVGTTSASPTYEISVYTNDPDEAMSMLTELARSESGQIFESQSEDPEGNVTTYQIVASYMLPTVMDRDIEMGPNHGVRVVQYASFGIVADVLDIKKIRYRGTDIEFAQATINFISQLSSNNKSGVNLMKSTSTGAALSFSVTLPSQRNLLVMDSIQVMIGNADKNTKFAIEITIGSGNDVTASRSFILSSATMNSVRGSIPSVQLSFSEYDE